MSTARQLARDAAMRTDADRAAGELSRQVVAGVLRTGADAASDVWEPLLRDAVEWLQEEVVTHCNVATELGCCTVCERNRERLTRLEEALRRWMNDELGSTPSA